MADRLPIYEIEQDILAALKATKRLILQAPTGSGKSTQVPQMLLKHGLLGNGQVVILQPRRLAARLLASRVAHELGVELGREVGYQVRFENCVSDATRIKFETEGILLRQLIQDPALRGIQAVIFDEFHERHLYGDITLARALDIQEKLRPDLLIAVMSATLDAGALEDYLSEVRRGEFHESQISAEKDSGRRGTPPTELSCSILSSEGRTFPVDIGYLPHRLGPNPPPVWELAADAFADYVRSGERGDVLVFMPGGFEISQTIEAIRHVPESKGYILLPLHGELQPRDQDAAVARYDQPKVVVATNVAETSITIDGVRLVIDSGLARIPALRREPRHQYAAGGKNQPGQRRSTGRTRRPDRAGPVPPALVAAGTRRTPAAGTARNQTPRPGRGGADAQGRRGGGFAEIPLAGKAG